MKKFNIDVLFEALPKEAPPLVATEMRNGVTVQLPGQFQQLLTCSEAETLHRELGQALAQTMRRR